MNHIDSQRPPFQDLQYCMRCCMPETNEGVQFDFMGICLACQSSEQKMHINWEERYEKLAEILKAARETSGSNYDCLVPISGGKDSVFQLHTLVKIFKMKPLAVTFSHNWFSETGWYNLWNAIEKLEVDHIMFTPNRGLVNRLAKRSLYGIGDACWHCHSGVGAFPLQIAVKYKIPLLIWGESCAEVSGRATYDHLMSFDRDYFTHVSAKLSPQQMINDEISEKDLKPFELPTIEECENLNIKGIHLGDYIFWDDERQEEFVKREYGWKETYIEGTYKRYKSAECIMPGVHDATCYLKRGFGRTTTHASQDVRAGLLTKEEAFQLINELDSERPDALDYFLEITGLTEKEFYQVMEKHQLEKLKGRGLTLKRKKQQVENDFIPYVQSLIKKNGQK